ncbi:MAG: hypothetical protein KME12_23470 [Trichocoleus desertorum ATA4-8-CV12]|jgi:hypothetical protein|nr:hypothetical protein [Trichocoleus desertorum ATA4-8-CV12]
MRTKIKAICIRLPPAIHKPKFRFWQRVRIDDQWDDYGVIVGMDYVTELGFSKADCGWWYSIELDESIPHKRLEPIRSAAEADLKAL